ncbi:MAG TPA: hypothetical protein VL524_05725, partial [Gemmatimonadaceae bacterium]|nr:hypothetical protein [Gemmatimonadaceae bacterium]
MPTSPRTLSVVVALFMVGTMHSTAFAQAAQPSDPAASPATSYSDVQNFAVNSYAYNSCQTEMIHLTGTEHV